MEPKREDRAIKAIEAAIAEVNELVQEDIQNAKTTTKDKIVTLELLHDARETILSPDTFGYCY